VTVAFVAPLQGFNNFLVYVRPRWQAYLEKRRKKRRKDNTASSTSDPVRASNLSKLLWRRKRNSEGTSSVRSASSDDHGVTDPSVLIAERNEVSEMPEETRSEAHSHSDAVEESPGVQPSQREDSGLPVIDEESKREEEDVEEEKADT